MVAAICIAAAAAAQVGGDGAEAISMPNPPVLAARIQKEVAEIRGLEFKKPIGVDHQSMEDFEKYLDAELSRQMPEQRTRYFGRIVQKLGLFRGPVIEDMMGMVKEVMKSQAAAYYDPATEKFYVIMSGMGELELGSIYAHELYHGLQDQYFDLDEYLLDQAGGALNDDELLARQAVVEGEATYLMNLWTMKSMMGSLPDRRMLAPIVRMQSQMDLETMKQMIKSMAATGLISDEMQSAMDAIDEIPAFMMESLFGVYLKGMAFVFEVHREGWSKVEELYSDPPVSSEQILHPEKWFEHEAPLRYEWPDFDAEDLFEGYELIDSNTIGELQWRLIFSEFEMGRRANETAAGWGGDSYAIVRSIQDDTLSLLLVTHWDTPEDATEFADAYRELLEIKYADEQEPTFVVLEGNDVFIAEGEPALTESSLLEFMKRAGPSQPTSN